MSIQLYNHITKKINKIGKDNEPINIYVCGSTVHATSHIGHGRTFSIFDSMRKYLVSKGRTVNYGMNVTDIDDKINTKVRLLQYFNVLQKINKLGEIPEITEEFICHFSSNRLDKIPPKTLVILLEKMEHRVEKYVDDGYLPESVLTPEFSLYKQFVDDKTAKFWEEMALINVDTPTVIIRVSDVIPQIENMITTLIEKGYAYVSNGSVYFNTSYYHENFCKCELSNSSEDEINIKDTHTSEKINPQDFALWKTAKQRSVSFNSKWGKGTVGWHIECSLMSSIMFGNNVDFHGGGIDLKYPHHHNEVLQSNSYFGVSDVFKHFSYVGHVCVHGEKMAQSVGNYLTLEDYLAVYSANSMRLLFWMTPWQNPIDLTDELVKQAKIQENKINEFLSTIKYNLQLSKNFPLLNNSAKIQEIYKMFNNIDIALTNGFKTSETIAIFNEIISETNIAIRNDFIDNLTLKNILKQTLNLLEIIGFNVDTLQCSSDSSREESKIIKELSELRTLLKKEKQYEMSDYVRDVLFPNIGYQVQDMKDGVKIKKI